MTRERPQKETGATDRSTAVRMLASVFTVMLGAFFMTNAYAASKQPMPSSRSIACEAVEQLISAPVAALGSPPRLGSDLVPPFRGSWKHARELRQGGWSGPPPVASLVDKWGSGSGLNAMVCANVRRLAASGSDLERQGYSHRVGLPVVNRDGTEALAQVVSSREGLGGSIYLFLLRKSGGQWSVVSRRMLLIS